MRQVCPLQPQPTTQTGPGIVGSIHHKHHLADCHNTTEDKVAEQQGIRTTNVPSAVSQDQILGNDVILTYLHSYDTSRLHHLNIIFFSVHKKQQIRTG